MFRPTLVISCMTSHIGPPLIPLGLDACVWCVLLFILLDNFKSPQDINIHGSYYDPSLHQDYII